MGGGALPPDATGEQTHGGWWGQSADSGFPAAADRFRGGVSFGPQVRKPREVMISRSPRGVCESNPQFIISYKTYLRSLGYPDTDYALQQSHVSEPAPRVPLLSEYPSIADKTSHLDLRVLMPPRAIADRLCEVFRTAIQNYTPLFVWPLFLEEKYERAFAEPIWEEDSTVVKSVFCIVQMMLAVASQMAEDTEELTSVSGQGDTQELSVVSVRTPHGEPELTRRSERDGNSSIRRESMRT